MIEIPTTCPCCGSSLTRVNDQLFCTSDDCIAQVAKRIEHFAKTIKIKGLGEKTIEKLGFSSILDIYSCSKQYLVDTIGAALGNKLADEIEKSLNQPLSKVIASLSIPLVGETAGGKLERVVNHPGDITFEVCKKAGLGDKASTNLVEWLGKNSWLYELPIKYIVQASEPPSKLPSKGKVVITGKLKDFKNRAEAAKALETLGFEVTETLNKQTAYLVNEEGKSSSKTEKAKQLNIPIVSIEDLRNI